MTLSVERFRDQLVGYLYGELEGESLHEFEASLRASEQYRSELATMQETLRLSRDGLAALRESDRAPPSRVSRAVLAAAAEQLRERASDRERETSSFWVFLRTPWLLPTLGVAAAVSVVVLYKPVESPKLPEYQTPVEEQREQREPAGAAPSPDLSRLGAPAPSAEPVEAPAGRAASSGAFAEGSAPVGSAAMEHKRDWAPARARAVREQPVDGERADEARATPRKAASGPGPSAKGYAVPPAEWSGRAREESPKKEVVDSRRASSSGRAEEAELAREADKTSDAFGARGEGRGGGGMAGVGMTAAKPAARPAPTAAESVSAAPPPRAPAASAPTDDLAIGAAPSSPVVGQRAEANRAPDESVKRAREHMNARRFGQAAVAYRELLQRYPHDARVPVWRSQLTAALSALSNVDAVR